LAARAASALQTTGDSFSQFIPIDADASAEKPESRIVDITDELLEKALIVTGATKA
jgi:hypothetical protein